MFQLAEKEIERLTGLRDEKKDMTRYTVSIRNLTNIICDDSGNMPICDARIDWGNASVNLLNAKIQFWECVIERKLPLSLKDKLNHLTDEWLDKGWKFLGQENIKRDSKSACDEIAFINQMYDKLPVIDDTKPKKKTRRGGKKK